jgi:carbonic anhydrase
MLLTTSLLVSTLVLATQACTDLGPIHARSAMPTNGTSNGTAAVTWGYSAKDGPLAWYAMDPQANQACGEGLNQTPINLNDQVAKVEPATGYPLKYQKVPSVDYLHTHHTAQVQVDGVDKNNTLMVKNQEYYLAQFHFHVPSEHRIEGEFFPLEVHFVHKTRGV